MEIEEIEQLVSLVKDANISELSVSTGTDKTTKLVIRKLLAAKKEVPAKKPPIPANKKSAKADSVHGHSTPSTDIYITAPMVGIFHGIESISSTGAVVKVGQVIGSIESMKLMNDIVSKYDGIISEILVEDSMPVEYGQKLFKINHL